MLAGCCIPRCFLVVVGLRMAGSGCPLPDQKSASDRDHHRRKSPISVPAHIHSYRITRWHRHYRGVVSLLSPTPRTMEKASLPRGYAGRKPRIPLFVKLLAFSSLASLTFFSYWLSYLSEWNHSSRVPFHAAKIQARCRALNTKPGPPSDFYNRTISDRFVEGTKHVWIRNATIWTGRLQGLEIIMGDVLLVNGIIKVVGHVDLQSMDLNDRDKVEILDARGAYVTPGYVLCPRLSLPLELKYIAHVELLIFIHIWVLHRRRCSKVLRT